MEKSGKKNHRDRVLEGLTSVQLKDSVICPLSLIATVISLTGTMTGIQEI